jgi:hypothetical protein
MLVKPRKWLNPVDSLPLAFADYSPEREVDTSHVSNATIAF